MHHLTLLLWTLILHRHLILVHPQRLTPGHHLTHLADVMPRGESALQWHFNLKHKKIRGEQ